MESATSLQHLPRETATTVGVVGLGAMGGAIAANLVAAGHPVRGFDIDPARVDTLGAAGGEAAASAAAAAAAEIVITSLPSEAAFQSALFGDEGIAAVARKGLVVVEASTLALAVKERARERLAARGATLLDCPLSGTGDQARTRDLVVMASGGREAVARCAEVFAGFARTHHYLGEFGAGTKLKLVANLLVGIHNIAAAEALALAERSGLDPTQALEVLLDGAGASKMLEVRGPKMLRHAYEGGVRMSVFLKDVDLIETFAAAEGLTVPAFARCAALYREALAAGLEAEDTAAVFELIRAGRSGGH